MSENQLQALTGCNAKQLDVDVYERDAEDGINTVSGIYVSFADLPSDFPMLHILAMRKVKFFSRRITCCSESHLTPARQLRAGQGQDLMRLLESQQLKPGEDGKQQHKAGFFLDKIEKLSTLITKTYLAKMQKEEEAQAARRAAEERSRDASSVDASSSEVREVEKNQGRARAKGNAAGKKKDTAVPSKRKPKNKSEANRRKTGDDASDKAGDGPVLTEQEIKTRMQHDPELSKVCIALGKVPECFHGLSVERGWSENMGNQIFSATGLQIGLPV